MATARVVINWQGIDEVIANLSTIEGQGVTNLHSLTKELATDTESAWKQATPVGRAKKEASERLQARDIAVPAELSFTLENSVYYYKFVDEGHKTPRGWHTKQGYRLAKHRSFVKGREMTKSALDFVRANIHGYLSRFLTE